MCEHTVKRLEGTDGNNLTYRCMKCGEMIVESKVPKKKSIIDRLLRR